MYKNFILYDGSDECKKNIKSLVKKLNEKYKGQSRYKFQLVEKKPNTSVEFFVSTNRVDKEDETGGSCGYGLGSYVCFNTDDLTIRAIPDHYYKKLMEEYKDI